MARVGLQALQMQVDALEAELEQERHNCSVQEEEVQSHRVAVRVMGCQVAELQRHVSETEDENSRLKKLAADLQVRTILDIKCMYLHVKIVILVCGK